jgi:hypothetical protein
MLSRAQQAHTHNTHNTHTHTHTHNTTTTMAVRMQALWSGGEAVKSKLSEVKRVKLHTGALVSGCKAEMLARLALWRSCLLSHFEAGPVCVCVCVREREREREREKERGSVCVCEREREYALSDLNRGGSATQRGPPSPSPSRARARALSLSLSLSYIDKHTRTHTHTHYRPVRGERLSCGPTEAGFELHFSRFLSPVLSLPDFLKSQRPRKFFYVQSLLRVLFKNLHFISSEDVEPVVKSHKSEL